MNRTDTTEQDLRSIGRRIWLTCVSLCRRCPVALICVLPFTVTSSLRGLAWPAMGLVVSPSRVQRPGTVCLLIFETRVSLCRRCPVALICILPFTVTLSLRGLAWPAMGLAVSPSRVQRPGTVCRLIFATCLYPLPVSSTNSRLNCSSGHIT